MGYLCLLQYHDALNAEKVDIRQRRTQKKALKPGEARGLQYHGTLEGENVELNCVLLNQVRE